MLSIENPLQDPPCSSVFKSLNDEKKASDNLETVDLCKIDLLDNDCQSLAKFSIRDYVLGRRGEDMSTNWPFSQKSLKLCMKHGLKELLPPFQSADAMRHPLLRSGGSKDEIDLLSNKNGKNLDDHLSVSLAANKELDSKTKSFTCSNKKSCLQVEDSGLQESLMGNKSEVFIRRGLKKRERIKCGMIMKLSNIPFPNGKEDTDAVVSEAVCPVCRVFSSSSNTTLNAHIDQCLSGESTPKELGISKLIKHRIKPRKVRLMVDIYKTAEHCTLEDLDRRNGTNWASNLALPPAAAFLEEEMLADDHNDDQELHFEENLTEGPVYIDSKGTKLRILSKSSDLNVDSMDLDGPQPKKMKKNKNQIRKQHSNLNLEKEEFSEINNPIAKKLLLEETNAQLKDQNQVRFSKKETIKGWVCSKRSSLKKKKINCSVKDMNLPDKHNNSDESPVCHNRTKSLALEVLAEHGVNQLSKDSSTFCKDYMASPSKRRVVIKLGPYKSDDDQLSTHHDSFSSKSRKIPSLRKRLQRGTARSVSNSELCLMVKSSTTKKKRREVAGLESKERTRTAKTWCEESIESSVVRCFNGSRGGISINKEEDMKSPKSKPLSYRSDYEEDSDPNFDPSSEDEFGRLPLVGSRKSLNHGFNGLSTQTEVHCHSKNLVYGAEHGILSSKHDIFCSSVTPESMIMVEEDLNEGQGNYMDPIPIPGPPGSFLPSPGRMDSDDLQGNSSLTSARFQCSIESPAVTSTNSISTMTKSGSKQSEKSLTLVAYSDFGNDQQCCFSRQDNVALNYQDSLLLKRRAMGTAQFCSGEIQMNSDLNRSPMPVDNGTLPTGKVSLGVSVDTHVKFHDNGDYEFADPPATPVLRLMGKNLMVMNKNETNASSLLKPFSYANLQAVSGHTNASSQNTVHSKVRCCSESRETCNVNPHDLMWSNGVGNYGNMAMSQTYAYMNPTMSSTQNINRDLNHHPGGYSSPNVKIQPANQLNVTPSTYNMLKHAHQPPNNSGDISSNTFRDVIIMDSTRDSEDSSTVISSNDCNRKEGTIGIPVSSSSDDQNFTSYYLTQQYKNARYSGFLFDANSSTQSPTGINPHPF